MCIRDRAKGTLEAIREKGFLGIFTGGLTAGAAGIAAAVFFGYLAAIFSKPGGKSLSLIHISLA